MCQRDQASYCSMEGSRTRPLSCPNSQDVSLSIWTVSRESLCPEDHANPRQDRDYLKSLEIKKQVFSFIVLLLITIINNTWHLLSTCHVSLCYKLCEDVCMHGCSYVSPLAPEGSQK